MLFRRLIACALGFCAAGCGGGERSSERDAGGGLPDAAPVAAARPATRAAPSSSATASSAPWVDPESPGAQALAESVVHDAVNRNKTTSLRMPMTTIAGRTTGIAGAATALSAKETSVEDRLSKLGAEITATQITLRLPGSILFDFDSAALRADAERTLTEVAAVLVAYAPRPVRVEGHTDSIASDAYNQGLSERRAASVAGWLAAHGVAANRVQSSGLGETKPLADNRSAAGRQQNRRVELILSKGD